MVAQADFELAPHKDSSNVEAYFEKNPPERHCEPIQQPGYKQLTDLAYRRPGRQTGKHR